MKEGFAKISGLKAEGGRYRKIKKQINYITF